VCALTLCCSHGVVVPAVVASTELVAAFAAAARAREEEHNRLLAARAAAARAAAQAALPGEARAAALRVASHSSTPAPGGDQLPQFGVLSIEEVEEPSEEQLLQLEYYNETVAPPFAVQLPAWEAQSVRELPLHQEIRELRQQLLAQHLRMEEMFQQIQYLTQQMGGLKNLCGRLAHCAVQSGANEATQRGIQQECAALGVPL
jgi:hypothetical protein